MRHLVEETLEGEADIDRAVATESATGRRVGEHAPADVFDIMQVVNGVEHRSRIEDGHHAIAGMRAATLVAFAFHRRDTSIPAQPELEPDVGFRPAAMGDERLLAVDHHAHASAGALREQSGDQLDVERLGAAAEPAADMRLDHTDARHVHVEDLRQHEVHVVRHLGAGMHGHAVALAVVVGDCGVHFHLVLAHLGAVVARLAHEIGLAKALLDAAELEHDVAFHIARTVRMNVARALRQRCLRRVVCGQLAHLEPDQAKRPLRRGIVDGGDRGDRLAAIAHLVARQRVLAARNGKDAEGLVAIGAGDDRLHPRKPQGLRDVHFENLGVGVGAAVDAPCQHAGCDQIRSVFRSAANLFRPIDHR